MKQEQAKAPAPPSSTWAAWIAIVAGTTHHLTTGMIHFLPALYALKLGASPVIVGLIPAAHSLPGALTALPGGKLVDRLGACRVTRWTTLLRIFVILLYLSVSSPVLLTIPGFLSGALATITVVSLHTYVTCISVGSRRRKEISRFALTGTMGELLGPTLAGAIVDLFGFTTAFLVVSFICALSSVAAFLLPQTQESQTAETTDVTSQRLGFAGLIVHPGIQVALWGTLAVAVLQGFLRGFVPVLLYGKYSATGIGALFFAASLASLLGRSAISWKSERWSPVRVLRLSVIVAAAPIALMPFSPHYSWLAAAMAFYGAGQGLVSVLGIILIAECVAAQERGFATGIRLTTMRIGATAGPLLFGPLANIVSVTFAFTAVAAVILGFGLLFKLYGVLSRGRSGPYNLRMPH